MRVTKFEWLAVGFVVVGFVLVLMKSEPHNLPAPTAKIKMDPVTEHRSKCTKMVDINVGRLYVMNWQHGIIERVAVVNADYINETVTIVSFDDDDDRAEVISADDFIAARLY